MNPLHIGESLSLVLIDAAAKGTVLLAAACLATLVLCRSSAAVRHRLWGLTMGGLVLLPALSWILPAWRLPILPARAVQETSPLAAIRTESERLFTTQLRDEDSPNGKIVVAAPAADTDSRSAAIDSGSSLLSPIASQPSTPALDAESQSANWVFACAAIAWGLGTSLFFVGVVVGIRRTGRLWRGSQAITDESWSRLARELCDRLGLRRPVHLREHAEPVVPLTWGLLRPIILLPHAARVRWSDSMRRAVLLHELAHVHRGDVAYQLLGRVACALYWFHPLAWIGLHHLRREREQACDDAVIGSGERASDYAEQLLEVARRYRRTGGLALAVEITHGGSLEQRVRALFDAARSHAPVGRRLAVALLAVTGLFVSAIAVLHPVAAEFQTFAAKPELGPAANQNVANQSPPPAPKNAATSEPSPAAPTGQVTEKIDHLKRFSLEIARSQRLIAAKRPADALPFLKNARRELALVRDAELLADERPETRAEDAAAPDPRKEWHFGPVAACCGHPGEAAIEIADGMQSPGCRRPKPCRRSL